MSGKPRQAALIIRRVVAYVSSSGTSSKWISCSISLLSTASEDAMMASYCV